MRVEDLLELQVDSIEHLDGYQFSMTTEEIDFSGIHTLGFLYVGWKQADPELMARMARETAVAGVWNAPTLTVYTQLYEYAAEGEDYFSRDEARFLHPDDEEYWRSSQESIVSLLDGARLAREPMYEFVRMLHEAGADLLIGTDTPNPYIPPGFSIHDELANFSLAGLSNGDILRMATTGAARFLDEDAVFGLIQAGMRADLLLVPGNPLDDLSVLKEPSYIFVGGHLWDQVVLRELREQVAEDRRSPAD